MQRFLFDIQEDQRTLRVQGKNKAARAALAGEARIDGAVVIPRSSIVGVKFKAASMLANGKLVVTLTNGHRYRMYFRKKQQGDLARLAEELRGALWAQELAGAPSQGVQLGHDWTATPATNPRPGSADDISPYTDVGSESPGAR